ncbi:MAG: hypothetical protein ACYDCG_17325 [Candidatus Acidiferrales bacterium]
MFDTRRKFLTLLAGAGTLAVARTGSLRAQAKPQQGRPQPADPTLNLDEVTPPPGKSPRKIMLEANEKDIKKNIEKLYQLASDLKAEVEKTDSSQVLSLTLVKKAEEIEKLARDIKTRAKA